MQWLGWCVPCIWIQIDFCNSQAWELLASSLKSDFFFFAREWKVCKNPPPWCVMKACWRIPDGVIPSCSFVWIARLGKLLWHAGDWYQGDRTNMCRAADVCVTQNWKENRFEAHTCCETGPYVQEQGGKQKCVSMFVIQIQTCVVF